MRLSLILLLVLASSCVSNVIQTRDHSVSCYDGDDLKLNTVLNPMYKLVFTGKVYELRLADTNKRLAIYSRCVIERVQPPPNFDSP